MKIAVIGYSGSGKSTLAGKLGEKYGIPVLYLDTVHFLPGWIIRDFEEKTEIIGGVIIGVVLVVASAFQQIGINSGISFR